jgi:tetratricopeptide (TPR) repeat protein
MNRTAAAAVALLAGTLCASSLAQTTAGSATTAAPLDEKTEADSAQALYEKQDVVDALPLYEDLYKRQPQSIRYEEHLAGCILGAAHGQDPTARQRAKALLLDAQKKGDNSGYVQVLLEKLNQAEASPDTPHPPGWDTFQQAESAFTRGDLAGAVMLYSKTLDINPQYYAAATFAGDAEYKQHHYTEASAWFAKAVAINPDIETAHRYWGDSLDAAGDHQRAEQQFIQAILAAPYDRAPRVGLKQWADRNHAVYMPPPIKIPPRSQPDDKGNLKINIDPSMLSSPAGFVWIGYLSSPIVWQKGEFAKHYPNEKTYPDSLSEQAQSLRLVLTLAREKKIDLSSDSTLKLLDELDSKGMLESWILLDHPDQGIAQDYIAYRKDHRDLMAQYIAQYDVHPM